MIAWVLVALIWVGQGFAEEDLGVGMPPLEDPPSAAEAQARSDVLSAALRCPVCQGLSVSDSPADAARAMKARIEELVAAGYTDEQVVDYFVDRYGEWVLLAPPVEGLHWIVWLGPGVMLLAGGALLIGRNRVQAKESQAPLASANQPEQSDDPFRQRILEELGEQS